MITSKLMMSREYQVKHENIGVDQKIVNLPATACIAALSSKRGVVANAIYDESITSYKFISFLKRIQKAYGDEPFVIYMDSSLRAHTSALSMKFIVE